MKKTYKKVLLCIIIFVTLCTFSGCNKQKNISDEELPSEKTSKEAQMAEKIDSIPKNKVKINKEGMTIETRYEEPKGFKRVEVDEESFEYFLRNQKLKPYGEKVLYYNGKTKSPEGVYDSVIDVVIGDRDLHQCADAVMLLWGEYLYNKGLYEQISFNFVSGFKAEYRKWMEGYRIEIANNNATWVKRGEYSNTYESFRKYMDVVFAYCSTLSLEKKLTKVDIEDMKIGDVFIKAGSPGHAAIVVDMAINESTGEKTFILAQSYMPAQQTQILINPNDETTSPWYLLEIEDKLITPEWVFDKTQLRRFKPIS